MELKEGMYVRTKYGITQYKEYDTTQGKIICMPVKNGTEGLFANIEDIIGEPSFNMIDLIETGDVIEYEIKTPLETSGVLKGITNISDKDMLEYIKNDNNYTIKSILTHEQFESMSYKVGE